ncbi:hypothetical protein PMAYCL1PPCAC_29251, partial [Pristionchus mayeri]
SLRMRFILLLSLPSLLTATALHPPQSSSTSKVKGPLTPHFQEWLNQNGYASDKFARSDYGTQGSYGGKRNDDGKLVNAPVIFIHRNSDSALGAGLFSGWTNSIQFFLEKGYTTAELYATSWGDINSLKSGLRTHDCETTQRLRRFLLAVQNYTKSDKVHIVGHSMGVTLGRKIVVGGKITAADGNCDVGSPLLFDLWTSSLDWLGRTTGCAIVLETSTNQLATTMMDSGQGTIVETTRSAEQPL